MQNMHQTLSDQGYLLWIGSGPLGILLSLLLYASSPACLPPGYCTEELVVVVVALPPALTATPLDVAAITTNREVHTTRKTTTATLQHANAPTDLSGRLPI